MASPRKKYGATYDYEQRAVRAWIRKCRGILSTIAVECKCSHQFVQKVAYGITRATEESEMYQLVARKLRENGWPRCSRRNS